MSNAGKLVKSLFKAKKESVMGKLGDSPYEDPMEPWSAKYAQPVKEEALTEDTLLLKYIRSLGFNPEFMSFAQRSSYARSNAFKRYKSNHTFEEEVEQIDEAGTGLLMSFIKSKGLNPLSMDGNQKKAYSRSSEFRIFKMRHVKETSGMGERGDDWNEEKKPVKESVDEKDTVTMDIPLLIRVLEYAREDAKTDMDLHKVVENLINMRGEGSLSMAMYDKIVAIKEEIEKLDELSKGTLTSYASKARADASNLSKQGDAASKRTSTKSMQTAYDKYKKAAKRSMGAASAESKARIKEEGVSEGMEDPSWKRGWNLSDKEPSDDPEFLFRKHGAGLNRSQFIQGFNANAKSRGIKQYGDTGNGVEHGALRYKEIMRNKGVAEGSAADGSVNYTLGHTPDPKHVYSIHRDGEKEGTYHSVDQAKQIVANMKKTSPHRSYKITRSPRNKMAGPKGQLPEQGAPAAEKINELKKQDDNMEIDDRITREDLRKWFSKTNPEGDWKRINSKGDAVGPCAREPGEPKPKCMSKEKRSELSKSERAAAVATKRKHDPIADRAGKGGKPVNVSNYGKGKLSESEIDEACWDTHKKVGMKMKGGKMVPDCRPKNEEAEQIDEKNKPTNPALWSRAKSMARSKFDVYPSAYANGWASKWYKSKGGGWKSVSEDVVQEGIGGIEDSPMSATNSVKAMESAHRKKNMKSARIIKSIYKKKNVKETMYDWEKTDKGGKLPTAKITMQGGTTMTGKPRDTVEIEPVLKTRPNSQKQ